MANPKVADQLVARAIQSHRQGNMADAIGFYRQAIEIAPHHSAALNLLGLAYFQNGEPQRALAPLQKALTIDPGLPSGHYNLGRIFQELKRFQEAQRQYELALSKQPGDAEIHNNLGTVLRALDRHPQAIAHFRRALELRPDYAAAHVNLGHCLMALGHNDEASVAFECAAALQPGAVDVHSSWGHALTALERYKAALTQFDAALALKGDDPRNHLDRGNTLYRLGRHADAAASFRQALALDPDFADAHISLGAALSELGRHEEAIAHYQRALAIRPADVEATLNRANALNALERFDEAIATYRQITDRQPDHATAHYSLGTVLAATDRHDEALHHYERAIALMPDDPRPKWNKAHLELSLGQFREGWAEFEQRWALTGRAAPSDAPPWNGGVVEGTLLVSGEQGLGDQIIYSSMIEDIGGYATSICLEVEPRLVPLFQRSFPSIQVAATGTNACRQPVVAQVPLPSLGRYLRPGWDSFKPAAQGFLRADPVRSAELRGRLTANGQWAVGLSWQSTNPRLGKAKSANLDDFAAVLRMPGCRFVDLQYGNTAAERDAVANALGVHVERMDDVDNLNDIDALAALISACDVVLSVSNTNAHLAGALGKPTWVLIPAGEARFWYWFRDRDDSPWYPRVRLKRRRVGQSWADVVGALLPEIAAALPQS